VKTASPLSSGKFSPLRFRQIHGSVGHNPPKVSKMSLIKRAWSLLIDTPRLLVGIVLVACFSFGVGILVTLIWKRRRAA
jgi:hypothetical protein